jgi:hypothetical protein
LSLGLNARNITTRSETFASPQLFKPMFRTLPTSHPSETLGSQSPKIIRELVSITKKRLMTEFIISSIVNQVADYDACSTFCTRLDDLKRKLQTLLPTTNGDSLHKIYLQFEFDCEDMPSSVRGIKVGRYTKKHRSIGIDAEIERKIFKPLSPEEQTALLVKTIVDVLNRVKAKETPIPDSDIDLILNVLPR